MQHGREKIQAVPFYTGLDNFETDQTLVFTTDEELECTDTEWEISDGTKLLIKLAEVFQACTHSSIEDLCT